MKFTFATQVACIVLLPNGLHSDALLYICSDFASTEVNHYLVGRFLFTIYLF